MVSCPMMPLGPASVGSGEGSVFYTAARVAEAAGRAQAEGKKRRCSRNSRDVITPEECLERFRGGDPVCVNEFHGRCSTGALEEAKEEKDMENYGTCAVCGKKGNRDKDDRCYRPECKKAREKVQSQPKSAGAPAEAQECRPSEEVQEQPQASPILAREEVTALDEALADPKAICLTDNQIAVPELPEDLDRPFSLGGFDFRPAPRRRMAGSSLAAITAKSLSLRTGVIHEHDLDRYTHARIAPSVDGKALAIKFYREKRDGACKIQKKRKSNALIAIEPLTAAHPEWIGREAALEWMRVEGWFLMRVGGEKGKAA